jgi:chromosome segregation ATPase
MRFTLTLVLMLVVKTAPAVAQPVSSDSQMTPPMLKEIRELRQDLRNVAATIQRVQIVMYRLQAQAALVDKAAQRLDQARSECKQAQAQQKMMTSEIERAETRKRNSQNAPDQTLAEDMISRLQSSLETFIGEAQQWQADQVDAETQLRAEQAKINEFQNQLDQLDQGLAAHGSQ